MLSSGMKLSGQSTRMPEGHEEAVRWWEAEAEASASESIRALHAAPAWPTSMCREPWLDFVMFAYSSRDVSVADILEVRGCWMLLASAEKGCVLRGGSSEPDLLP